MEILSKNLYCLIHNKIMKYSTNPSLAAISKAFGLVLRKFLLFPIELRYFGSTFLILKWWPISEAMKTFHCWVSRLLFFRYYYYPIILISDIIIVGTSSGDNTGISTDAGNTTSIDAHDTNSGSRAVVLEIFLLLLPSYYKNWCLNELIWKSSWVGCWLLCCTEFNCMSSNSISS